MFYAIYIFAYLFDIILFMQCIFMKKVSKFSKDAFVSRFVL